MPDLNVLTQWVARWAEAMGRAAWQGSLALLLVWLICRLVPRLSPHVQCWLWRLAYLKLFVTLFWATPVNLPLLPPRPQETVSDSLPPLTFLEGTPKAVDVNLPKEQTPADPPSAPLLALGTVWLAGSGWCALQFLREWRNTRRLRARCRIVDDPLLLTECQGLCRRLGIRRPPQLLMQDGSAGPLLFGLIHPSIILPQTLWNDCTPAQQRLILAHELMHLKRRDLLWAWVPSLGRCAFFFLPFVWLAEREWQQSQEMACDEQVMQLATAARSEYGDVLLKVSLQLRPASHSGLAALHVAESYTTVRRRLIAMKHAGKTTRRSLWAAGALVAALGLAGIVPWRVSAQDNPAKGKAGAVKQQDKALLFSSSLFEKRFLSALNLTTTQQRRIESIVEMTERQVRELLTPDQMKMMRGGGKVILDRSILTEAQMKQMDEVKRSVEKQMHEIEQDQSLSDEQRGERMGALKMEAAARFQAIMTPEQREQLDRQKEQEVAKERNAAKEDPLNLTDAQKERLVAIKQEGGQRMQRITQDTSLTPEQREERMKAIKTDIAAHFQEVLTPAQRQIAEAREAEAKAHRDGPQGMTRLEQLGVLTPVQKAQLKTIYQRAERQVAAVLTSAQKRQLKQLQDAAESKAR